MPGLRVTALERDATLARLASRNAAATGVDAAGRIVIDSDGREVVAAAGDVTHLRALDD